jgi:hypothetical protein
VPKPQATETPEAAVNIVAQTPAPIINTPTSQHQAEPIPTADKEEVKQPNATQDTPISQHQEEPILTADAEEVKQPNEIQDTPSSSPTSPDHNPAPELQPNDINFPQLSSPGKDATNITPQQQPGTPQAFIWRRKTDNMPTDKEKGKQKTPSVESAPLTRQGYRSGRLADDFWEVLKIPGTPNTQKRKLRVIPFISKNQNHSEYLVDNCKQVFTPITTVYIAEQLAGVPWTVLRARQHIVDELAHALHKILIFSNQNNTPIYKWEQSTWFAQWTLSAEGDNICTLYANIVVPESKIKIRKGRMLGWRKIPTAIQEVLTNPYTNQVQDVADMSSHWQDMLGQRGSTLNPSHTPTANLFAVLNDEDTSS